MKKSRIATCHACNAIKQGIKSRIALRHTCGREPSQPQPEGWEPSDSRQKNPYAPLQTPIDEELENLEKELSPEDFDRIQDLTETHFKKKFGYDLLPLKKTIKK